MADALMLDTTCSRVSYDGLSVRSNEVMLTWKVLLLDNQPKEPGHADYIVDAEKD